MVATTSRRPRSIERFAENRPDELKEANSAAGSNLFPASEGLRLRAARMLEQKIEFIPSVEFERLDLAELNETDLDETNESELRVPAVPAGIPAYLAALYRTPLLSPEREQHLFRKFNFLKWQARQEQTSLNVRRPARGQVERLEQLLAEAAQVRNQIIQANLRLVVANARKYADADHSFEDLVSDGNLTLVQAVEKFDYSRGFRFSTYATHAIRRTFFRRMARRQKEKSRLMFGDAELLQTAPQPAADGCQAGPADLALFEALVEQMSDHLNEREITILKARYSLETGAEAPTLQTLARQLGICKERVRQLQIRAVDKLRELATELRCSMNLEPSMLEV